MCATYPIVDDPTEQGICYTDPELSAQEDSFWVWTLCEFGQMCSGTSPPLQYIQSTVTAPRVPVLCLSPL
jgi:hypothetical protein